MPRLTSDVLKRLRRKQEFLRSKLCLSPLKSLPHFVAGVDVAYDLKRRLSVGTVVVLSFPDLALKDKAWAVLPISLPYVPGFLSFREVPVLRKAIKNLSLSPDVILVDGQGILHPRQMGLATHLGITLGIPTIGVAKKPLVGDFELPREEAFDYRFIKFQGKKCGVVLRSRTRVKPIYVSPGHLITLKESLEIVKKCLRGYRLPEPLRLAHQLASNEKKLLK